MAAKRTYTDEQLDYIKRYWRKYPTRLVAEQLGMTPARVNSIASRHGLIKNKNKARTPLPEFVVIDIPVAKYSYFECVPNPTPLDYVHCKRPVPPRKNWLQRIVSWLLEGKA